MNLQDLLPKGVLTSARMTLLTLMTLTIASCSQSGSVATEGRLQAGINIPRANLPRNCADLDPGLSGDKGVDAVNYKTALKSCENRVRLWSNTYNQIRQRFNRLAEQERAQIEQRQSADEIRRETERLRNNRSNAGV